MPSREQKLVSAAGPYLAPGEAVLHWSPMKVGSVRGNAVKSVATAAATAVLTAGTVAVMRRQAQAYVMLTDRRQLLLFEVGALAGSPGRLLGQLPAGTWRAHDVGMGALFAKARIALADQDDVQLTVAPLPPAYRSRGRALLAALV